MNIDGVRSLLLAIDLGSFSAAAVADDASLARWIGCSVAFAESQPAKCGPSEDGSGGRRRTGAASCGWFGRKSVSPSS